MNKKLSKFTLTLVIIQFILTFVCFLVGVMYLFGNKGLLSTLEILVGVNLIVIGINNYIVYKNKKSTIIYISIGLFMILIWVLYLLGVIQ